MYEPEFMGYRFWLLSIVVLAIIAPFIFYYDAKENEAYMKSKITFGIIDKINRGGYQVSPYMDFHYFNDKNEKVKIEKNIVVREFELSRKCLNDRKIGDTVIIEYSLTDNQYAKIINCYWNDNLKRQYGFYKRN
jgi:hypothetical protein